MFLPVHSVPDGMVFVLIHFSFCLAFSSGVILPESQLMELPLPWLLYLILKNRMLLSFFWLLVLYLSLWVASAILLFCWLFFVLLLHLEALVRETLVQSAVWARDKRKVLPELLYNLGIKQKMIVRGSIRRWRENIMQGKSALIMKRGGVYYCKSNSL